MFPFRQTYCAFAEGEWRFCIRRSASFQTLTSLDLPTANWLRDESTVLPALAIIGIWQNLGYAMVLFLAGLKSIPQDLYVPVRAKPGADGARISLIQTDQDDHFNLWQV